MEEGIDLVIFDCDGVLVDSEFISARMLVAELEAYGVSVDRAYVARHFLGRSYPVVLAQIRADFGIALPDGFEADYRERLLRAFDTDLKVMPGVPQVIAALNTPYCLATSSSPQRLARTLQIVGLEAAFRGRTTTATEVANGKPAPDLFLLAAAKCGADPARCLVIEDSLAGISAARSAGMTVWHFTGGSHLIGLDIFPDARCAAQQQFESFREFFHLAPQLKSKAGSDDAH